MSYLPAPYESAQQDDLPAALAAGLAVTLAGITSWTLASWVYRSISTTLRTGSQHQLSRELIVPAVGWSTAALLMVVGGLLLIFRAGRGSLILGALISVATTAVAQYSFNFGPATESQWWLYWGGVAVVVVAALPATKRWINKPAAVAPDFPATATYRPH